MNRYCNVAHDPLLYGNLSKAGSFSFISFFLGPVRWKNRLSIDMPSEKQYLFLIRRLARGEFWTENVPFVWQWVNRLLYIKYAVTAKNAIHIQQNVIREHQQVCLRAKYKRAKKELCHQATLSGAVLPPTTWLANHSTKGESVGLCARFLNYIQ